ncbi:hypothetical protein TNCV_1655911 [Trichonephila clavipes]|nr:hypothetical protein TNCV_1655911 [Trichonephila clavipes]
MGPEYIFMDDNAWSYRTCIVDEFHEVADIGRVNWLSRYPDHNSIEYLWNGLGEAISQLSCPPRTLSPREKESRFWKNELCVATDTY